MSEKLKTTVGIATIIGVVIATITLILDVGKGWSISPTSSGQSTTAGTEIIIDSQSNLPSNMINATDSLIINSKSYAIPTDTSNIACIAGEQTGYSSVKYSLVVPEGWVVVWDSWKAYWPNSNYEQDGFLVIYGNWDGEVTIVNGEYCAVPVELIPKRDLNGAVNNPDRQKFIIGEAP